MFAPYLLIRRIGGDVLKLIGKPQVGYLGSHVIRHQKVPILLQRTCSFAGAASVPEFAIIKRYSQVNLTGHCRRPVSSHDLSNW
jgi:hypothetical protein